MKRRIDPDSLSYRFTRWIDDSPGQLLILVALFGFAVLVWVYTFAPLFV